MVGVLFVIATAAALASTAVAGNATTASDYLTSASVHATAVKVGDVLTLMAALAVALIPAFLFPILRRHNEAVALGYQAVRILEAVVMMIGAVASLLIVSLSQGYVGASSPTLSAYQATGAVLQGVGTWTFVLDPLVFGTGAVLFYALLYRTRLVPWWLSLWGLLGAVLIVAAGAIGLFGSFPFALAVPIAVQEMALAAWLILFGFDPDAVKGPPAPGSASA